MKCPVCKEEMDFVRTELSFNDQKKEYKRDVYSCKKDDTWMSAEIPKTLLA